MLIPVLLLCVSLFSQEREEKLAVYFETDSFSLGQEDKDVFEVFFGNPENLAASLSVEGFCDDTGTAQANRILSLKRANAVADYLRSMGQKPNSIVGKGELPLGEKTSDSLETRQKNRKVTVTVRYHLKSEPSTASEPEAHPKDEADPYTGYKTIKDTLAVGDKIMLRRLLFQGGRTAFVEPEETEAELKEITDFLKANPQVEFEIHGHVCCITKSFKDALDLDTRTTNLSETRALRIYNYFLEQGIAKSRMTYKGFGRQFPRPGIREQLNKRVEILITKI